MVNIQGTRNLIKASQLNDIRQFIYTSTASVVFDGSDLNNVNETHPYCTKYLDPYIETKIIAEREVLAANSDQLRCCALRPSGIFGPNDSQVYSNNFFCK